MTAVDIRIAIIVLISSLIVAITLRFISLGMNWSDAIRATLTFPIEICYIHYVLYRKLKNEKNKHSIKLLFLPITDLPRTIISYADMKIDIKVKLRVTKELLSETKKTDRKKLIKILSENGVRLEEVNVKLPVIKNKTKPINKGKPNLPLSYQLFTFIKKTIGNLLKKINDGIRLGSYEDSLHHKIS
ncbi:hypothetical protein [Paenibacillus sp. FSL P4-0184]|uniref:hypothetical protein n=1 Tax=Paenibacillus sp. FSL P4-0184 TaxID=2921632 RepID=UPI0030FD1D6B